MTVPVQVKRLPHSEGLALPAYATPGAAGMDLLAAVAAPLVIPPGGRVLVPTGLAIALPPGPPEPTFEVADLRVDLAARRVWRGEAEVHLTPTEYKLLTTLVRHAGKVLTHLQLLKEVWGSGYVNQSHYVRVYVGQLRQKIESDPTRPRVLVTEPGVGYRLKDE